MDRARVLAFAAFTLVSSGCVTADQVARTRAANDFNCSSDKVGVINVGGNSYRATGCGQSAVYDCAASDAYKGTATNYTCVPEGRHETVSR